MHLYTKEEFEALSSEMKTEFSNSVVILRKVTEVRKLWGFSSLYQYVKYLKSQGITYSSRALILDRTLARGPNNLILKVPMTGEKVNRKFQGRMTSYEAAKALMDLANLLAGGRMMVDVDISVKSI